MTPQEAKILFEEDLKDGKCNEHCPECNARELAISALEKQIPKKPLGIYDENIYHIDDDDYIYEPARFGNCPSCNKEVQDGMLFCSFCGQALDWSEAK